MPKIVCDCGISHFFTDKALEEQAGKSFRCSKCGKVRKIPAPSVIFPPPTRPSMPRTKRLMVGVTIAWLVGMVVFSFLTFFVLSLPALQNPGKQWVPTGSGFFRERSQVYADAFTSAMILGLTLPTVLYAIAMIVLFVLWFAYKPESR